MIIQGTNIALTFEFPDSVSSALDMEVTLYTVSGEVLKRWGMESIYADSGQMLSISEDGMQVFAPLDQEESADFPEGECFIDIKWLTEYGETIFATPISETVVSRRDRNMLLDEEGGSWTNTSDPVTIEGNIALLRG
jgi:hypothetical protein